MSERGDLWNSVAVVITNVAHFPKQARPALLGSDLHVVIDEVTDALIAAGYRKQES